MLVDSHCHLNLLNLAEFDDNLGTVIKRAHDRQVGHFLCVCVDLDDYPLLCRIADTYPTVSISVGSHPTNVANLLVDAQHLVTLATTHPACIAIGETGLDYYHVLNSVDQKIQQQLFREHINASIVSKKPLIIHTRQAPADTLRIMNEENASNVGGVMHCFSENWDVARQAIAMNFYISFSGIVTFKNANLLQEVAKKVPLDRLLIETDAPYLAPTPYRGKQNQPAFLTQVALTISQLKGIDYETIAHHTTENFKRCFNLNSLPSVV
jgi:TatD DNase family protein